MKKTIVRILIVTSLPLLTGCYHYVANGDGPLTRGTPIRVHLAPPTSFELSELTAHDVELVDAEVVRDETGRLIVSARWFSAVSGAEYSGRNGTFTIARSGISALEIRKVSWWRTAFVLGGGFIATLAGFDVLGGGGSAEGPGNTGGSAR